jgi:hypothetical protein
MKIRSLTIAGCCLALPLLAADKPGEWKSMFDGKSLDGWKANEHSESWTVDNGMIKGAGPASHLFWMVQECENCEFKADVRIMDGANSGMYFRTAFGPGFPKGYEAQVNSTHRDPVKTGSLYNFVKVFDILVPPGEWFSQHIVADGNHIVITVSYKGKDNKTVDYIDEKNTYTKGYLALQQHDPGSVVYYKNLMYRELPAKH